MVCALENAVVRGREVGALSTVVCDVSGSDGAVAVDVGSAGESRFGEGARDRLCPLSDFVDASARAVDTATWRTPVTTDTVSHSESPCSRSRSQTFCPTLSVG